MRHGQASLPQFTLLFEPAAFWRRYYQQLEMPLPVNVTGSNPTLLLHSPALRYEAVSAAAAAAPTTAAAAAPLAAAVTSSRSGHSCYYFVNLDPHGAKCHKAGAGTSPAFDKCLACAKTHRSQEPASYVNCTEQLMEDACHGILPPHAGGHLVGHGISYNQVHRSVCNAVKHIDHLGLCCQGRHRHQSQAICC